MIVKRGDVFYADLSPVVGSEQGGVRPVLIVQNDVGNRFSPTVIVAAITSQINKAKLPTHIEIKGDHYGLPKDSVILMEQIRTIDKKRLREQIGQLDGGMMPRVNKALMVSFALGEVASKADERIGAKTSTPRVSTSVAVAKKKPVKVETVAVSVRLPYEQFFEPEGAEVDSKMKRSGTVAKKVSGVD